MKEKKVKKQELEKKSRQQSRAKQKEKQSNKEFKLVFCIFLGLFLLLIGYFVYFIVWEGKDIINNPYNTRINLLATKTTRGIIYGRNNEILAETIVDEEGEEVRYYPYGSLFVHTVGYNSHGKYGIEYDMNYNLLTSNISFIEKLINDFVGKKDAGNNVHTTLDAGLQRVAYDALGEYNGAVVVLEVSTGKVLAMVSKPDFDPNNIAELWDILVEQEVPEDADVSVADGAMLNRATQGLYTPGSVFKIITALAYMRENPDTWQEFSYSCNGAYEEGGNKVSCYHGKVHGEVDFESAFALSCNAAFAQMGQSISYETLKATCEGLLMNQVIAAPVASANNSFKLAKDAKKYECLYTSIGQGETLITPLYGALLASAVANDGVVMAPYMVEGVSDIYGEVVEAYDSSVLATLMTAEEARILDELMTSCVEEGTGYRIRELEVKCAGKTGTAETSNEKPNAWFVGYATDEQKEDIAFCIVVEESGTGSDYAVPVAEKILTDYYSK